MEDAAAGAEMLEEFEDIAESIDGSRSTAVGLELEPMFADGMEADWALSCRKLEPVRAGFGRVWLSVGPDGLVLLPDARYASSLCFGVCFTS